MKDMDKKKVFMIGMPSSGKTTYLASLCRLLLYGGQETGWKLDVKDVPEGFERVQILIKNINSYKAVKRTYGLELNNVALSLYNQNQEWMQFVVPDSSGEIFRDLVYDRRIASNIMDHIVESDMLLFFINVNTMIWEERIKLGEKSAIKQLNEEQGDKVTQSAEDIVEEYARDRENEQIKSKEQVKNKEKEQKKYNNQSALVELLQIIIYLVPHSLNIRFVISAWDLVEKEFKQDKVTPKEYIKIKLPLLYQYLEFNSKLIDYEIWGVSAQGGDFDDEDDLKKLQSNNGEDYICVVDSKADTSKDLTKLL
jgi:hypothetical protein